MGVGQICPPLARWSDMLDGTYCLEDVHAMHEVLDDITERVEKARSTKT